MAISPGVDPYTSVPGMPKSEWNLREMRKMIMTTKN